MKPVTFVACALCLIGCSREASSGNARLVPASASEVMASPDYKLEHTTKAGVKYYVRPLPVAMARSIPDHSPDLEFLNGDNRDFFFFLVPINPDGKIIDGTKVRLSPAEEEELTKFVMKKLMAQSTAMQKDMKQAQENAAKTPKP